jgi:hypothetical protein
MNLTASPPQVFRLSPDPLDLIGCSSQIVRAARAVTGLVRDVET